jgi:hypothetical protein
MSLANVLAYLPPLSLSLSLSLPSTIEVERDIITSLDYDSVDVRNLTLTYSIIIISFVSGGMSIVNI